MNDPHLFNLMTDGFIPCRMEGKIQLLGIQTTLLKAHEIEEIRDSSPLVTMALHRLLLAVVHHMIQGPKNEGAWKKLWDQKKFVAREVENYCNLWRKSFDLHHDNKPFYQDAAFQAKEQNGINQLVRELSRGNNATLFDHTHEDPPPKLPVQAVARSIIAEQSFAIGGGKSELGYTSGSPTAGCVLCLLVGNNLFETLLLNLLSYPDENRTFPQSSKDSPYWVHGIRPITDSPNPRGYLDYLTWQSRSIHLNPDADGTVQFMSYAAGRMYDPPGLQFEPMSAYRRKDKNEDFRPVRLDESKALWRESAALFQFAEHDFYRGPRNLAWLKALKEDGILSEEHVYTLSIFGLCTDKAKVNFWRQETLPIPLDYLSERAIVENLEAAIKLAEEVGLSLRMATASLVRLYLTADPQRSPDKNRQWQLVESLAADALYYSRLERPFRELMLQLPTRDKVNAIHHYQSCLQHWFMILKTNAQDAYQETAKQRSALDRERRAVIEGERQLQLNLYRIGIDYQPHKEVTV